MPELTITVSDEDLKALDEIGDPNGLSPRRVAERIVHRNALQASGAPRQSNRDRAVDRATRQVLLVRQLEQLPAGRVLSREEIQQLAEQHGVAERTLYRDLQVARLVAQGPEARDPANGYAREV